MGSQIEKHFDKIAKNYDYFKRRNWYYYQNLKALYKKLIPEGKSVLEVGCGTGDLISILGTKEAVGIDISLEMIKIAREKHSGIVFEAKIIENFESKIQFDYIFLADVIEHMENIPSAMEGLRKICNSKTKVIFTYANPLWEPILMFLEKMKLKMPEGPHYRIPYYNFKKILENYGFETKERGWRLLFPAYIPVFSFLVNDYFHHIPGLKRLGMLEYLILKAK